MLPASANLWSQVLDGRPQISTLRPGEASINQSAREKKLALSAEVYSQSDWYKTSVRSVASVDLATTFTT